MRHPCKAGVEDYAKVDVPGFWYNSVNFGAKTYLGRKYFEAEVLLQKRLTDYSQVDGIFSS